LESVSQIHPLPVVPPRLGLQVNRDGSSDPRPSLRYNLGFNVSPRLGLKGASNPEVAATWWKSLKNERLSSPHQSARSTKKILGIDQQVGPIPNPVHERPGAPTEPLRLGLTPFEKGAPARTQPRADWIEIYPPNRRHSIRPIDANEFTAQAASAINVLVNAASLPGKITVDRADNDTRVRAVTLVKGDEVLAVPCQNRAAIVNGVIEHRFVRHGRARLAGIICRDDVVTKSSQLFHDRKGIRSITLY